MANVRISPVPSARLVFTPQRKVPFGTAAVNSDFSKFKKVDSIWDALPKELWRRKGERVSFEQEQQRIRGLEDYFVSFAEAIEKAQKKHDANAPEYKDNDLLVGAGSVLGALGLGCGGGVAWAVGFVKYMTGAAAVIATPAAIIAAPVVLVTGLIGMGIMSQKDTEAYEKATRNHDKKAAVLLGNPRKFLTDLENEIKHSRRKLEAAEESIPLLLNLDNRISKSATPKSVIARMTATETKAIQDAHNSRFEELRQTYNLIQQVFSTSQPAVLRDIIAAKN